MRWPVFFVVGFAFLAFDASLGVVLTLGGVVPRLLPILVVFVSLFASRGAALWAAWMAGLMLDLVTDLPHGAEVVGPVLGPHALGYVFGAYAVLQARPLLLRRHVLTVVAMTLAFAAASNLVTVFVYSAHGWYEQMPLFWADLGPLGELWRRTLGAVYTTVMSLLVGPLLLLTSRVWMFRATSSGAVTR